MRNDQRIVYKYRLQDGGETKIKGWFTRIMHVGEQNGELYIWMENSLTRTDFSTGEQVPRDDSERLKFQSMLLEPDGPMPQHNSVHM